MENFRYKKRKLEITSFYAVRTGLWEYSQSHKIQNVKEVNPSMPPEMPPDNFSLVCFSLLS